MKTSTIKTPPEGIFEVVNIEVEGWENQFKECIRKRQKIQFDVSTMPNLPKDIQAALNQQRYVDYVLESDKDQHYLIPRG